MDNTHEHTSEGGESMVIAAPEEANADDATQMDTAPPPPPPRNPKTRPIYKLSCDLIVTYNRINEVYYAAKRKRTAEAAKQKSKQKPSEYDDENFDYKLTENEIFNERYRIIRKIGKGSFGQVVQAFDMQNQTNVALKIIKNKRAFAAQAQVEIRLLTHMNQRDAGDDHCIVRLLEHFTYHNHLCLVFELLSVNLYELLKNTDFCGVSLNLVRKFAHQILVALSYMARPDINIIHCDLKPENILLRNARRSAIKVIDFGSSCHSNEKMYSYIQSRFYRSPEVLLGIPYTIAIDMWSLGCILVEMHTGEPLFPGTSELDQLCKIMGMRGPPTGELVEKGSKISKYFELTSAPGTTPPEYRFLHTEKLVEKRLEDVLGVHKGGPGGRRKGDPMHTVVHYQAFMDLVDRMLHYDAEARITPDQALQHPFFTSSLFVIDAAAMAATPTAAGAAAASPTDAAAAPPAPAGAPTTAAAPTGSASTAQSMDVAGAGARGSGGDAAS